MRRRARPELLGNAPRHARAARAAAAALLAALVLAGCSNNSTTGVEPTQDFCAPALRPVSGEPSEASVVTGPTCMGVGGASILAENGGYRMWYACDDLSIRVATSSDGDRWTEQGVVLSGATRRWNALGVFSPAVVRRDTVYHMLFTGIGDVGDLSLGHATSRDGVAWSFADSVISFARDPYLTFDGTRFVAWFAANFPPYALYRFTSIDGRSWSLPQSTLLPHEGWEIGGLSAPTILRAGGQYHMWYQGVDATHTVARVGYARSGDGLSWSKCVNNPVLDTGGPWESGAVGGPEAIRVGDRVRIYYVGRPSTSGGLGAATLGYALTLPNCLGWDCYQNP